MATADDAHRDEDDDSPSEAESAKELPPELKAVPPDEMRAVLETAALVALRMTKSKRRADELLSDVFIKLTTTRPWDRDRTPLLDHVLGALRSELNHQYASKAPARERAAHEGYHREVIPLRVESIETRMLARAQAAKELASLEARISKHDLARKVFRCKADGIDKPADIARTLDAPVEQIYRALELMKHHLERIRAARDDRGEDE